MFRFARRLYDWTIHWADTRSGPQALAAISFAESSFFPVPPDVLLIPLCVGRRERSFRFATICTVASVLGAVLGYLIGMVAEPLAHWIIEHLAGGNELFEQVRAKFNEYGVIIVLAAAFTPIPYKLITISAGLCGMPFVPFIVVSFAGRGGRFYLVAALIYLFGAPVRAWIEKNFNFAVTALFVLGVGGFVVLKWVF